MLKAQGGFEHPLRSRPQCQSRRQHRLGRDQSGDARGSAEKMRTNERHGGRWNDVSARGVARSMKHTCGSAQMNSFPPWSCTNNAAANRHRDRVRIGPHIAATSTECNSSGLNEIGFPLVLLALSAFLTTSPACSSVRP